MRWRRRLSDLLLGAASQLMFAAMRVDPTRVKVELKIEVMFRRPGQRSSRQSVTTTRGVPCLT